MTVDLRPVRVEGWLTAEQASMLAAAASSCTRGGQIVEIGSFRGLSTIVLAEAAPAGASIVAIDPHAGNDRGPGELEGFEAEAAADRAAFERNLDRAGVVDRVRHVPQFSANAHGAVDGVIDVLYIDGAHRYRPARADIRDWGARVADGGVMVVHDAFSSVGVTLAIVRELVFGDRFLYVDRSRSLARYDAIGPMPWAARLGNAARQVLQLGWFTRNLVIKVLLMLGVGKLLRRLGRPAPEWPY